MQETSCVKTNSWQKFPISYDISYEILLWGTEVSRDLLKNHAGLTKWFILVYYLGWFNKVFTFKIQSTSNKEVGHECSQGVRGNNRYAFLRRNGDCRFGGDGGNTKSSNRGRSW